MRREVLVLSVFSIVIAHMHGCFAFVIAHMHGCFRRL
jgi:hypothetical protein